MNGQRKLIFRHTGTRVLADGTRNAFSERLLGRTGGNTGVVKSDAAEPFSAAPLWSCLFHLTAGVCEPLTFYLATKLSAWQDGAALIPMDLRVPCSGGLATADLECARPSVAICSMEHPAK